MAKQAKIKMIDGSTKLEAHEYEWPDHVVQVTTDCWELLSFPELRIILAMLGVDPDVQPKDKHLVIDMIEDKVTDDTVRGQAIYEMICKHKLPKGTTPLPSGGKWTSTDFMAEAVKLLEKIKTDLSKEAVTDLVTANMAQAQEQIGKHIAAALASARKIEVVLPNEKPTKVEGVTHEALEPALQLVSQGFPIMLVGPTQCGKTTLAKQLAAALKLKFAAQSLSGGMTEGKLLGRQLPRKGGAAEFVGTPFLHAYEEGWVFLADEFDAADSNVPVSINMGLANKEIWIPDRDEKPVAKMHKNFRLIATANTFGFGADARYVGRNALDYATLERFGCGVIYMDYDKRIEAKLARKEICDWAWGLRNKIRASQLDREMSTRTIAVCEQMTGAYGWTLADCEKRFFANWSAEERRLLESNVK